MTLSGSPLPVDPALDRLLSEAHIWLRQGQLPAVRERLTTLQQQYPNHPAVLEFEGDVLFTQGKIRDALASYQQARVLDPANARLEEKYATAVVQLKMPDILAHTVPDDDPWNHRIPRAPWASAGIAAIFPGLGQFYNGEMIKGGIIFTVSLLLIFSQLYGIMNVAHVMKLQGIPVTTEGLVSAIFSGANIFSTLLSAALWLYGIIDAAVVAQEGE